jgi:hypothetical protein
MSSFCAKQKIKTTNREIVILQNHHKRCFKKASSVKMVQKKSRFTKENRFKKNSVHKNIRFTKIFGSQKKISSQKKSVHKKNMHKHFHSLKKLYFVDCKMREWAKLFVHIFFVNWVFLWEKCFIFLWTNNFENSVHKSLNGFLDSWVTEYLINSGAFILTSKRVFQKTL